MRVYHTQCVCVWPHSRVILFTWTRASSCVTRWQGVPAGRPRTAQQADLRMRHHTTYIYTHDTLKHPHWDGLARHHTSGHSRARARAHGDARERRAYTRRRHTDKLYERAFRCVCVCVCVCVRMCGCACACVCSRACSRVDSRSGPSRWLRCLHVLRHRGLVGHCSLLLLTQLLLLLLYTHTHTHARRHTNAYSIATHTVTRHAHSSANYKIVRR